MAILVIPSTTSFHTSTFQGKEVFGPMPEESPYENDWTEKVLRALRNEDRQAASLLIRRHGPWVLRRAERALADRPIPGVTADDLVSETWKRVFGGDAIKRFRRNGSGSFAAWMRRLQDGAISDLRRRALALKRGGSVVSLSLDETAGGPCLGSRVPAADTSPTSAARYRELVDLCEDVLSEREWEAWWLIEVMGHTSAEVAAWMKVSDASVRSLLHRARGKILDALGEA